MALHDHNEEKVLGNIVERLLDGESVALLSDAGTPLVSDPGFRLVREAHRNGIQVSPIPGASAVTAALSVAGIPTDRFCFEGFLPSKPEARKKALLQLADEQRTLVFFESVHRIDECLHDMADAFSPGRPAFIGRELSKLHEQCVQAPLGELAEQLDNETIVGKGEFVVIVGGAAGQPVSNYDVDQMLLELAGHMSSGDAAKITAKLTGQKKNALYERLLTLKSTGS
tara:strand:- start:22457 stop:23137 length:681 start_codon:yes stop_codon:yes gene_type:complete